MTRKECLDKAAECVLQNRQDQYGDAEDCFKQISRLWSAYLAPAGVVLESFDVACMMALLKIARIQANPKHGDSWVDLAGYAACGADIAVPEPFRYDKPKAEGGCCQNGNDQPEKPEFKPGDAVEWNSIGKNWCPAVYEREFGDFGHCVVRLPDGRERIVSKVDLRRPEANYPENPDSSKRAEGCEDLVQDEESDVERVFGTLKKRPAPEYDAPQTAQELYNRIIANNPATFEGRAPTGEELAEMAEGDEKHG